MGGRGERGGRCAGLVDGLMARVGGWVAGWLADCPADNWITSTFLLPPLPACTACLFLLPAGFLWWGGAAGKAAVNGAPPAVSRAQLPDGHLNLKDQWSRVYLARACAAAIQSGYIAGGWARQ